MKKVFSSLKEKFNVLKIIEVTFKVLAIGIAVLALTVGVPILIDYLFKKPAIFNWMAVGWEVEHALSYYGSLLAAVATIIGVFISMKAAQKNYREDARNRILPYIALTHMRSQSNYNAYVDSMGKAGISSQESNANRSDNSTDSNIESNDIVYREYRLGEIYIIVSPGRIVFKNEFTESQKEKVEKYGTKCQVDEDGSRHLVSEKYISVPCEIENVGSGPAVDLRLAFYRSDSPSSASVNFYTFQNNNQVIYFHIFSEVENSSVYGEYTLELRYRDIQGNRYSQKYLFHSSETQESGQTDNRIKTSVTAKKQELLKSRK